MDEMEYLKSIATKPPEKQKLWKRVPFLRGIIIVALILAITIMTTLFIGEIINRSPKKLARLEYLCSDFNRVLDKYGKTLKSSNLRSINAAVLSANNEVKKVAIKIRKNKYKNSDQAKMKREDMTQASQLERSLEESLIQGMLDQNYPAIVNYSNHTVLTMLNELRELNQDDRKFLIEIQPLIDTLETIGKSITKHLESNN